VNSQSVNEFDKSLAGLIEMPGRYEEPSIGEICSNAKRTDMCPLLPIAQIISQGVWSSERKVVGKVTNSDGEGPNRGTNLSMKNDRYSWHWESEYEARFSTLSSGRPISLIQNAVLSVLMAAEII
jgi:hypothetical protein